MERETTRVGVVDVGGGHHPRLEVVHGGGGEGGGFGAAAGGEGGIIGGGRGGDYVGDGGRGRRLGAATGRGGRHFGTERHVQQTRALFICRRNGCAITVSFYRLDRIRVVMRVRLLKTVLDLVLK